MSDLCAWCNHDVGLHSPINQYCYVNPNASSADRFSKTRKFTPYGAIEIGDVPDGSTIKYAQESDPDGTIITHHYPTVSGLVLVGWTQIPPTNQRYWVLSAIPKSFHHHSWYQALVNGKFQYGYWPSFSDHIYRVTSLSSSVASTTTATMVYGGMACDICRAFNDYAQPNQPNGTYICYVCRS